MFVLLTHDLSYRGTFILNVAIMGDILRSSQSEYAIFQQRQHFWKHWSFRCDIPVVWLLCKCSFHPVQFWVDPPERSASRMSPEEKIWQEVFTHKVLRHLFELFRNECLGVFKWGDESFSIKSKALYINPLFIAFVKLAVFKIYKRNGSYNKSTSIVGIKMNKGKFNRDF